MPHLFSRENRPLRRLDREALFNGRFPWMIVLVTALLSTCCQADRLIAQESGGAAAPDTGGAGNVVVTQPFPWVGLFVTLLLVGLCLFAVCRSSRRN